MAWERLDGPGQSDPVILRAQIAVLMGRFARQVFQPVEGGFVRADEVHRALAAHPTGRVLGAWERRWPGAVLSGVAGAFRESGVTVESRAFEEGGTLAPVRGLAGLGLRGG